MFRKLDRKLPLAMQFAENAEGSRTARRSEIGDLEIQNRHGQPVLVVGLGIADLRLGLL